MSPSVKLAGWGEAAVLLRAWPTGWAAPETAPGHPDRVRLGCTVEGGRFVAPRGVGFNLRWAAL